jgi:hypothetical protein
MIVKDHLVVEGSMLAWNWNTSFKEAVRALQTKLSDPNKYTALLAK